VLIVPARVQGDGAAEEIAAGIQIVNAMNRPVDCLVVARGGGSMEDLWSFNEEVVVRAIAASRIPVISAVGHEIDVTLSDLAADVRALTPSEAAELVAPASEDLLAGLRQYERRLAVALRSRADAARSQLDALARHSLFRRPYQQLFERSRRLDELDARSLRAIRGVVRNARQHAEAMTRRLESLSPLGVLGRGYSLTQRTSDGKIIRAASELSVGDQITTRFAQGQTTSRVERIEH
jgi:exodeoxyribonuclease VII large subunit